MSTKPQPQLISREAAHAQGLRRYFTGEPCKKGHTAARYVSNGGCVLCTNAPAFKFRQNAFSHDLAAYAPAGLWAPRSYTPDDLKSLEGYLQRCIYEHCKHSDKLTDSLTEAFTLQLERSPA